MRNRTNYAGKRPTGFAPLFHAALVDAARLTNGHGFKILMFVWNLSLGRVTTGSKPYLESTEPITTAMLAELACCDERTVQRELKDMQRRGVVGVAAGASRATYVISPLFRTWAKLPSYSAGPVAEPKENPAEYEATEETPEVKEKTATQVTRKPVHVPAGRKSKQYPVECGVSALQFDLRKLAADCSASVANGVMTVTVEPRVEVPQIVPSKPELQYECDHPRAAELAAIFDPLLWKSSHKTLSGDISCLQRACEAIGDTPHDVLVKAVQSRSARPITGGPAVVAICKEVATNARRAESLPVEKKLPTMEEINAIIEQERKELAAKRRRMA
jgi:hypothetical protein